MPREGDTRAMAGEREPRTLRIFVGGFIQFSYGLRWEQGKLFYDRWDYEYEDKKSVELHPTDEAWQAFWDSMDAIQVWEWEREYEPGKFSRGMRWKVELAFDGRSVKSAGKNTYPPDGTGPTKSDAFKALCAAASRLAGGREFK